MLGSVVVRTRPDVTVERFRDILPVEADLARTQLRAVELETGKRFWFTHKPVIGREEPEDYKGAFHGTAFVVKNGDRFFLFSETGDLIIAKLSPKGYEELSRAKLLDPTGAAFGRKVLWSHPAFARKCVYVRNDKELACYSLAAE